MSEVDLLIRRMRAGELELYGEIIRRYELPVWRVVAAMLLNFESAREMMQQVFVDAYLHLDQYQIGTDFEAWIKTIARNVVRQHLRSSARESQRLARYREQMIQQTEGEASRMRQAAYLAALSKCRQKLADPSAQAIAWRYDEGKSMIEIAELLKRSKIAVEKLLSRARIELRKCIERQLADA